MKWSAWSLKPTAFIGLKDCIPCAYPLVFETYSYNLNVFFFVNSDVSRITIVKKS